MSWTIRAQEEGIQHGWVVDKSWIDVENYVELYREDEEGGGDPNPSFPPKDVEIIGPRGTPFNAEEIRAKGKRFRMYDDDDNLYYEGSFYDAAGDEGDPELDFSPLEDYGSPNAGCTHIRYLEEGKWVLL